MTNQTRIIKIDGMTCEKCVDSVHGVTAGLDGLMSMTVELPTNQATVTFDDSKTSAENIASVITDGGFDAKVANA